MSGFKGQGFFGVDASRQASQLEQAARAASKSASESHLFRDDGIVENGELRSLKPGGVYRIDSVSSGKGARLLLPLAASCPGAVIKIGALKDTGSPYTTFTVIPAADDTLRGEADSFTFQGRRISLELVASGNDWTQGSLSSG